MPELLSFYPWVGEFFRDKISIHRLGPEKNESRSGRRLHESVSARREKPRTIILGAIERPANPAVARDDLVRCRDHNFEVHPHAVRLRRLQESACHPQVVPDRNIICPDKLLRMYGHPPFHDRDTRVSLNSSLGCIIGYKTSVETLHHDRFRHRPKTALPKDGFAFAIQNVIAGVGQFQNSTEKIRLSFSAIDPEWTRENH